MPGSRRGSVRIRPEFRFFATTTLAFVFYFIACNNGSGWLYLLGAALGTPALFSLILPLFFVSKVQVNQQTPARCVAGQVLCVILKVSSKLPGQCPLYWLQLRYDFAGVRGQAYVLRSAAHEDPVAISLPPIPRGVHPLADARVSTCFPLGMVWAERTCPAPAGQTITAYPKTLPVDGFFLYKLPPSASGSGGLSRGARAARQSTSTRGVREYVRGDSPRIVHWASTARTGRLLVREFEAEGLPRFDISFDLSAPWANKNQFELAVTTVASLLALGYRLGTAPRLTIEPEGAVESLQLPACAPGIETHMEILARVQPLADWDAKSASSGNESSRIIGGGKTRGPERNTVSIAPQGYGNPHLYYAIEIAAQPKSTNPPGSSLSSGQHLIADEEDISRL